MALRTLVFRGLLFEGKRKASRRQLRSDWCIMPKPTFVCSPEIRGLITYIRFSNAVICAGVAAFVFATIKSSDMTSDVSIAFLQLTSVLVCIVGLVGLSFSIVIQSQSDVSRWMCYFCCGLFICLLSWLGGLRLFCVGLTISPIAVALTIAIVWANTKRRYQLFSEVMRKAG